ARRAAHVELHLVHLGRRLDGDAAGVEGDALAYQHDRRGVVGCAVVAQDDEARRLFGALRHGQEGTHAERLDLLALEHLYLEPELLAQALGLVAEVPRAAMVARAIGPFTCQHHAGGDALPSRQTLLRRLRLALGTQQ